MSEGHKKSLPSHYSKIIKEDKKEAQRKVQVTGRILHPAFYMKPVQDVLKRRAAGDSVGDALRERFALEGNARGDGFIRFMEYTRHMRAENRPLLAHRSIIFKWDYPIQAFDIITETIEEAPGPEGVEDWRACRLAEYIAADPVFMGELIAAVGKVINAPNEGGCRQEYAMIYALSAAPLIETDKGGISSARYTSHAEIAEYATSLKAKERKTKSTARLRKFEERGGVDKIKSGLSVAKKSIRKAHAEWFGWGVPYIETLRRP